MAAPPSLKQNYKCLTKMEVFYTGGPVAMSPDGTFVACACLDHVKVVDLSSGAVRCTMEGDSEPITALSITPDGACLFAASRSRVVKLWHISTSTCIRSWKAHEGPVANMAIDSSGGLLATAGADRAVFVWDVERGYCTHAFRGHTGVVTTVVFNIDKKCMLLISGSDDATIRVWDLVKKKCLAVLEKHFSTVTSLVISTANNCLLSAGRDKVVNVWNMQDFSLQTTVPVYEAIEAICIFPDDSELLQVCYKKLKKSKDNGGIPLCFLTAGERGTIRIWLAEGGKCVYEHLSSDAMVLSDKEEEKRGFTGAVLLPSANKLMCITGDQRLLFYTVEKSDMGDVSLGISKRLIGNNEEVIDLRFLPGEDNLLAVATNLEQIRIYDIHTAACRQELFGHQDIVLCLDSCLYSSTMVFLASGGKDHMVRVWDIKSGSCIAIAEGHMGAVGALAFSRRTKKFLVSGSSDHTIKVWSLAPLEERTSGQKGPAHLSSLSTVAAHDKDINSIAVAPNDSLLCTGSQDRTARIWKLPELVPGVILRGHKRGIWSVQFSPVDQCVLTASGDKTIRVWSLVDGSCLKTFEGHTASVLKASFLSRGTQIISAGADGLLKLWTIKANECVNTFDRHEDKIWALDVRTGDEMLASGGSDSVVNIWTDCTQDDEEEALRKEEEETLKDQDLSNAIANTDYATAVMLSFELGRPFKLLNVFTELFRKEKMDWQSQVQSILKNLDKGHLRLLLGYIREWNTKPKFCHVAQRVLSELFRVFPSTELIKVSGLRELLEGILPYTERHFSRMDRLLRSTFLLDYTLSSMSVLNPQEEVKPSPRVPPSKNEDPLNGNHETELQPRKKKAKHTKTQVIMHSKA
ncbi:hypothetical protein KP509_15G036100 [Ceratopteris richardii]|uniref:U3 small nucleolar RNA-associated protein 13 C-terminal domain-containing protein n=1 Tax=Ceratopteris richardii TaxID=49495 RepID=A0A8T2T3E9_CERRI|nr:hypothetical protein KP509_15G036100 [Ceratopteris richardii]